MRFGDVEFSPMTAQQALTLKVAMLEWFGSRSPAHVAQRPALVNRALVMVFVAAFGAW